MKATRVEDTSFNPIKVEIEISTVKEWDILRLTVESIAPVDSTPASLNQMQYDFACKLLILLRNAAISKAGAELEVK